MQLKGNNNKKLTTASNMSQITSNTCYTCEAPLLPASHFFLFQCSVCKSNTLYCQTCTSIVSKLLGPFLVKCSHCNAIEKPLTREEVATPVHTPMKATVISPMVIPNSTNQDESDMFEDFSKKLVLSTPEERDNDGKDAFVSRYNLLSCRKKFPASTSTKKFITVNNSVNNSFQEPSQFAGFNKKSRKSPFTSRNKRIIIQKDLLPVSNVNCNTSYGEVSQFSSKALQKVVFSTNYNEKENMSNMPGFGTSCKLGSDTPHKFNLNFNPGQFKLKLN